MKRIYNVLRGLLCVAFFLISFCACEKEIIEPLGYSSPVDLTVEGLEVWVSKSRFYVTGSVPKDGCAITVTADGENSQDGFVETITDESGTAYITDFEDGLPVFTTEYSSDWGTFEYLSTQKPYKVRIVFLPNLTGQDREVEFFFGIAGKAFTCLVLTQEG